MHIIFWCDCIIDFYMPNTTKPTFFFLYLTFCFLFPTNQSIEHSSWLIKAQVRGKWTTQNCWCFESFQSLSDKDMISNKTFHNTIVLSLSSKQSPLSAFDPIPLKFPVIQMSQNNTFYIPIIANQLVGLHETNKKYLKRLF